MFGHFASLHGAAGRNFLPPFAKSEMKPDEPMARACANTWVRMPMHAGAVHAFVCAPQARRAIFGTREQQLRPMVARRRRARRFLAPTHACGAQRRRFFWGSLFCWPVFLAHFLKKPNAEERPMFLFGTLFPHVLSFGSRGAMFLKKCVLSCGSLLYSRSKVCTCGCLLCEWRLRTFFF